MTNYPAGDFLIRIKNAAMAGQKAVSYPKTKMVAALANALKKEGFLSEVKAEKGSLVAQIAIYKKNPLILGLKLISRPGLRVYMGGNELSKIRRPSTTLVSTPKGILTAQAAAKQRLGGELIAEVW